MPQSQKISAVITDTSPIPGLRLATMRMPIEDVVTFGGSILGGDIFSPVENPLIASIVAEMIDEGTLEHSKNIIREKLESVGALVQFSAGQSRLGFAARCLKRDVRLVLRLLAEQLQKPLFSKNDFVNMRKRALDILEQGRENTRLLARTEFQRKIFTPNHPNYSFDINESINFLQKSSVSDLKTFHEAKYGLGEAFIVAVGDIDERIITEEITHAFGTWKQNGLPKAMQFGPTILGDPVRQFITVKQKENTNFFYGQSLGITREHLDFEPLNLGVKILGDQGLWTRLNSHIRGKLGLTYGAYSQLDGLASGYDGYFLVQAIFAPSLLKRGMRETEGQVRLWVTEGVTQAELESKKKEILGSYVLAFETTGNMAALIVSTLERGKQLSYLDEYPEIIRNISLEQVNTAIKQHIHPEKMVTTVAGSIDSDGNPLEH